MATPSRESRKQHSNQVKAVRLARSRRKRRLKVLATLLVIVALCAVFFGVLKLVDNSNSTSSADQAETPTSTQPETAPVVPAGASITGATPCPAADGSVARASSFEQAPTLCINPAKNYTATFDTNQGKIVVALDTKATPNTTNNFVVLSRYKYYDGSAIVRTNTGIDIIQGGAPSTQTNGDPGPGYTIKDEGLPTTYVDGDLVMANTGSPDSSGAQFFFGAGPNVSQLDSQGSYIKFGKVTEGIEVVHTILGLHQATDASDPTNGAPSTPVVVNSITIAES